MKVRELYSSNLLVIGLVCLALGLGNWIIGAVESSKYQSLLLKTAHDGLDQPSAGLQPADQSRSVEILRYFNEDRERYNAARVKLNFFYVVLTGGRILFLIGSVILVATLVRLIRRDAKVKIQKLVGGTN